MPTTSAPLGMGVLSGRMRLLDHSSHPVHLNLRNVLLMSVVVERRTKWSESWLPWWLSTIITAMETAFLRLPLRWLRSWYHERLPPGRAARRTRDGQIGEASRLQGTTERPGEQPLRQANQFFYITGVVEPRAILLIDGKQHRSTLFLNPRNERREKMMFGPGLYPGDEAVKSTGIESVLARDEFKNALDAIGGFVDDRVKPVWALYLSGGQVAPKNYSGEFAGDFADAETTLRAVDFLQRALEDDLVNEPPTATLLPESEIDARIGDAVDQLGNPHSEDRMNFFDKKTIPGNLAGD